MSVPFQDALLGSLTASASNTIMNFTTSSAAAANSRIVCFITWVSATGTLTSVTGGGLTWTIDATAGPTADNKRLAIVSADCPAGLASGTVIQGNFSAAATARSMCGGSFLNCQSGSAGHVQSVPAANTITTTAWSTTAMTYTRDGLSVALGSASTATGRTSTVTSPALEMYDLSPATGFDQISGFRTGSSGTATIAGAWNNTVTQTIVLGVVYEGAVPPLTLDLSDTVTPSDLLDSVQDTFFDLVDTAALVDDPVFGLDTTLAFADSVGFGGLFPGAFYPGTRYPGGQDSFFLGDVPPIPLGASDTLPLADSLSVDVSITLDLVDAVALVDALATDQGIVLTDTVSLLDGLSLDLPGVLSLDLTDVVVLADLLDLVAAYVHDLADALSLADALDLSAGMDTVLADTLALDDVLVLGFELPFAASDTVTLTDEVSFDIQRQWLIGIPEEDEDLVELVSVSLVFTPAAEDTRELVPTGGDVPLATALPESSLVLTPIPEGEH